MRYTVVTPVHSQLDTRTQPPTTRLGARVIGNFEADATGPAPVRIANADQALPAPTSGDRS